MQILTLLIDGFIKITTFTYTKYFIKWFIMMNYVLLPIHDTKEFTEKKLTTLCAFNK